MIKMTQQMRIFAACLASMAGFVDAVGFVATGGYFLSFMSGNTTRMAVGLVDDLHLALFPGGIILCFVSGVVIGTMVGRRTENGRAALLLTIIAALLALGLAAYSAGWPIVTFALTAVAMGAENTISEEGGALRVGLTYMTGTLVKLGQHISAALTGGPRFGWLPYLLLWSGLASGAIAGAFAFSYWGINSLWIAVVAALVMSLVALRLRV